MPCFAMLIFKKHALNQNTQFLATHVMRRLTSQNCLLVDHHTRRRGNSEALQVHLGSKIHPPRPTSPRLPFYSIRSVHALRTTLLWHSIRRFQPRQPLHPHARVLHSGDSHDRRCAVSAKGVPFPTLKR
jgi:hypothetical protein